VECNEWIKVQYLSYFWKYEIDYSESIITLQRFGDLFGLKFNTFFLIRGFGNFVVVCGFHLWFFFNSLSKLRYCESMVVWWINDQDTWYFEGLVIGSLYISLFVPGIIVGNAISSVISLKGLMKVVIRFEIVNLLLRCWVHVPTEFGLTSVGWFSLFYKKGQVGMGWVYGPLFKILKKLVEETTLNC